MVANVQMWKTFKTGVPTYVPILAIVYEALRRITHCKPFFSL